MNPILTAIWNFPFNHPIAFAAICTGTGQVAQWTWNSFIGALPAPTATSSPKYKFWFKFLNLFAANLERAKGPKVEESPNFQDAVNNLPGPENKPVVVVEAPRPH